MNQLSTPETGVEIVRVMTESFIGVFVAPHILFGVAQLVPLSIQHGIKRFLKWRF
jgi:hypothetical protein